MTTSEEALKVAMAVKGAYTDMVTGLSGGEAAHVHQHLVQHLQWLALAHPTQFATQTRFALQVLDLLARRMIADPPVRDAASTDCERATAFICRVVDVMAGALGDE